MELKEWLALLVVPGIIIGGFYWLHQQIKAAVKLVRDEARTAHKNIGENVGMVREDVRRVDSKVDELAKETRHLHRSVGQLEGTVGRVARQDR